MPAPKTLYVSDLDGTLLRSDQRVSEHSCEIINRLVGKGMIFSYATARSFYTSSVVAAGLTARLPLIVYNGAVIIDSADGSIMQRNFFDAKDAQYIFSALREGGVSPIVYSFIDGIEKFSYNESTISPQLEQFVSTRSDRRKTPVSDDSLLMRGDIFYFTCIDTPEKLSPLNDQLRGRFNCLYQTDLYTGHQWLEIIPRAATKANAIMQLKKLTGCDRIVSFGDGINDLPMFSISDECYAVGNACEELKAAATGVIGSNDSDSVARWLEENAIF